MRFTSALLLWSAAFCLACGEPMGEGKQQATHEQAEDSSPEEIFVLPTIDSADTENIDIDIDIDADVDAGSDDAELQGEAPVAKPTSVEHMDHVKVQLHSAQNRADDLLLRLRVIEKQLDEEEAREAR